jgi:predicted membrane GTPase involved in stress response
MPTHPEYPIEQAFGSDDPSTQQQLMQLALQSTTEPNHALLMTDYNGLRVLARSETALHRLAEALRRRFGAKLLVGAPEVRYADRVPVLEPYMVVLVNAPASCLSAVRKDFVERRGRITRLVDRGSFVLEGEAPLATLLGYDQHMRSVLADHWDESHVAMWLSRYVPVHGNGPAAA